MMSLTGYPLIGHALGGLDALLRRPLTLGRSPENSVHLPCFDVHESQDSFHLEGELPGVEKKDIDVTCDDRGTLQIRGHSEHRTTEEDPQHTWWCSERSVGDFRRSFSFPSPVDQDNIDAAFENGVLSITVKKAQPKDTSRKQVTVM
ncbi:Hsp20/alpha crystallin family protein [Aspergillus heterothallicus]